MAAKKDDWQGSSKKRFSIFIDVKEDEHALITGAAQSRADEFGARPTISAWARSVLLREATRIMNKGKKE